MCCKDVSLVCISSTLSLLVAASDTSPFATIVHESLAMHYHAPLQFVEPGYFPLESGVVLPRTTYRSEFLRIEAEARAANWQGNDWYLARRIKQIIWTQYGRRCHICVQIVDIHFDEEPILRKLATADLPQGMEADRGFYMHQACWRRYQRDRTNARRRQLRLQTRQRNQQQQQPAQQAAPAFQAPPPLLAIADGAWGANGPIPAIQEGPLVDVAANESASG